jgi:hypothetical protein
VVRLALTGNDRLITSTMGVVPKITLKRSELMGRQGGCAIAVIAHAVIFVWCKFHEEVDGSRFKRRLGRVDRHAPGVSRL